MTVATEWIDLPSTLSEDQVREDRGVLVKKVVSKYDSPRAVRAFYDESEGRLTIEFQYFGGPEPMRHVRFSKKIFGFTGKKSQRIYGLRFEELPRADSLVEAVDSALIELRSATDGWKSEVSSGNSEATKSVLFRVLKPLLPPSNQHSLAAG
ncbi:hypothetical protein [Stenotrophomonas maltophilia]|uniref:Uncharacterized protein n=1 Tax=Stenotrophomonas maltophilia TaxID=40324 RepID=A0A246I5E0_STEMA|nr:hypothetical protein [Stenotrophomonas maltophilia]OWQ73762.1 hypothetical protein CEE63_11430 [Stenotrophomonas maltophilia]